MIVMISWDGCSVSTATVTCIEQLLIEDKRQKVWEEHCWAKETWLLNLFDPDDEGETVYLDRWEVRHFKGCTADELPNWDIVKEHHITPKEVDF